MSASFDTLSFARRLEAVGFTREQAETLAEGQGKLIDERLAKKAGVEESRQSLTRFIEQVRADLSRDIERLRQETTFAIEQHRQETRSSFELAPRDMELLRRDLTIRLGGIVIATVATASAVITLAARLHP